MQKIWLILLICMFTFANIPKDRKVSEETKSDSDSNERSNSISTTVSRKKKKSSAESNTSSSENENTSNDYNTSQRGQDETFVPRVYSLME